MPVPEDLAAVTEDADETLSRDKSTFWKLKGIAAKTTFNIFCKYCQQSKFENDSFANIFQEKYSIPLLESNLKILFTRKHSFVGSKCLNFAIKFISASTHMENTMENLKPFVKQLLYETMLPIMLITEKDVETFESDPIEYVNKLYDFSETSAQPKNQVKDLLKNLTGYSSKRKRTNNYIIKVEEPEPDYLVEY